VRRRPGDGDRRGRDAGPAPDGTSATEDFGDLLVGDCFIPQIVYSTTFGYRTDMVPEGVDRPSKICDVFDLETYPGKRALEKRPINNMEWALLCDGVAKEDVYDVLATEEGQQQALDKLDTIKDDVIWWSAGADTPQLLADGEIFMGSTYNGRLFSVIEEQDQPVAMMWDAQVFDLDGWIIPAGLPEDRLARALDFVYVRDRHAASGRSGQVHLLWSGACLFGSAGGQHADLGIEMAPHMPTDPNNAANTFLYNYEFWADYRDDIDAKFQAWLAPLGYGRERLQALTSDYYGGDIGFVSGAEISELLPLTAREYAAFALFTAIEEEDVVAEEEPWEAVKIALVTDLRSGVDLSSYSGPGAEDLRAAQEMAVSLPEIDFKAGFEEIDEDWVSIETWRTIQVYSPPFTSGYFLNAADMQKGVDGPEARPENQQIYMTLFQRTLFMSVVITVSCIALGYPIAWLLANLPMRTANLLLILVLLPFWTSLLVRTSAWKVMLQQQGVINDVLVWLGMVADDGRLVMINNQFGTIVAMTHILLPFMILPMYSVMQTIPPSYLRAAKSLGATNWTAFWRVYFPQSVPGIGAGSILVFILAIGYYITPEIVGGRTGVFISNQIAYHISSSLNWGLAAALGTILLAAVLILYWAYDKIVGIDNVKLG
jgi:ABC-type spermidine/putrescine transport system permease subunit I